MKLSEEIECPKCSGKGYLPPRTYINSDGRVGFRCIYACLYCAGKGWVFLFRGLESSDTPAGRAALEERNHGE